MYYTYIFESKEGFRSIGVTKDVDLKLKQCKEKLSIWTKKGTNWKVVYMEEFSEESAAMQREVWLKTAAGKYYINTLFESAKT